MGSSTHKILTVIKDIQQGEYKIKNKTTTIWRTPFDTSYVLINLRPIFLFKFQYPTGYMISYTNATL